MNMPTVSSRLDAHDALIAALSAAQASAANRVTALEAKKVSAGIATLTLTNLLASKTQDVAVNFIQPMPSAVCDVTIFLAALSSLTLFGNLKITLKTKNTTTVVLTIQNTSLVTLSGSATIIVIAQS